MGAVHANSVAYYCIQQQQQQQRENTSQANYQKLDKFGLFGMDQSILIGTDKLFVSVKGARSIYNVFEGALSCESQSC